MGTSETPTSYLLSDEGQALVARLAQVLGVPPQEVVERAVRELAERQGEGGGPHELDQELTTFERELPALLKDHEGEFVLIKEDRIDSFWKTEDEALDAGSDRFTPEAFLVARVEKPQPPMVMISHPTPQCRP